MTTTITRENFTKAMREAVAERGADYVYPVDSVEARETGWRNATPGYDSMGDASCVYALSDGTPACIIGLALYKIDPELLAHVSDLYDSAQAAFRILGVTDRGLMSAARGAQICQDDGETWGSALEEFEAVFSVEGEEI